MIMLMIRIIFWASVAAVLGYALTGDTARRRLAKARAVRELRKAGVSEADIRQAAAGAVSLAEAGRPVRLVGDASKFIEGMAEASWASLPAGPDPAPSLDPDCVAGKHSNCPGLAWDNVADEPTSCECACHSGVES